MALNLTFLSYKRALALSLYLEIIIRLRTEQLSGLDHNQCADSDQNHCAD